MTVSARGRGILEGFTPEERKAFETYAKERAFEKGDTILAANQYNASLFIVTEGSLQARLEVVGGDSLLARIEAGNFFGEVSVFDPGSTSATVVAATRGTLLEIERDVLLQFLEENLDAGAGLLIRLLQEIARRVRIADERLGDAILLNRPLKGRLGS